MLRGHSESRANTELLTFLECLPSVPQPRESLLYVQFTSWALQGTDLLVPCGEDSGAQGAKTLPTTWGHAQSWGETPESACGA